MAQHSSSSLAVSLDLASCLLQQTHNWLSQERLLKLRGHWLCCCYERAPACCCGSRKLLHCLLYFFCDTLWVLCWTHFQDDLLKLRGR